MDAVVTRKYTFFEGINVPGGGGSGGGGSGGKMGKYGKFTKKDRLGKDKLDLDKLGKDMFSKDWDLKDLLGKKGKKGKGSFDILDGGKDVDFWSAFGPGRLLKNKKGLKKKKSSKMGLGALLDFETTSPLSSLLN